MKPYQQQSCKALCKSKRREKKNKKEKAPLIEADWKLGDKGGYVVTLLK